MPDYIGRIPVPALTPSETFPLVAPDYPHGQRITPKIVVHRFISANGKIEQRFKIGAPRRRWMWSYEQLTIDEVQDLQDFFNARLGPYEPFYLNVPDENGDTESIPVFFEDVPLTWQALAEMAQVGITFVEYLANAPTYTITGELDRFPTDELESGALLEQEQEFIPLITIRPLLPASGESYDGYPDINLSDRKCTVGDIEYLPRLITWSGIRQQLGGQSDTARMIFGNADRVMNKLVTDPDDGVDLFRASISFSLYHVNTGYKLNIWKGDIIDFEDNRDTFEIAAVDGLYDVTLQYPSRRVSPVCWKAAANFNDGRYCPFAEQGALNLIRFPSASGASCDGIYLGDNGCRAHGMERWFGGIVATPQSVQIKDNTTGFHGFGRQTATATSIVSESMMGQPLIEIYTDVPMPVKALLVAGRDESDFYEGLGIVGEGPITKFAGGEFDSEGNKIFHTLDGQPAHTYPSSYGREVKGLDPAGGHEYFSLDQGGNVVNGDPDKEFYGSSTYLKQYAASTAFVSLRRVDEKGFQLTKLDEHEMQVWVSQGMKGWVWTAPGERTLVGPLVNPAWVTINIYLRGIGVRLPLDDSNPSETNLEEILDYAETKFDIQAAIDAAFICDQVTTKVIGEGTETQFVFQGVLRDIKVLKDWIQEILNSFLGLWLFSNGKFKILAREDAAAAHSFSGGNILIDENGATTLKLTPLKPTFNRLTASFANRDYNFVADTIPVEDKDHIKRVGRAFDSTINFVGAAGKSMAGRIITTRLKEELGGVGYNEQKKARRAFWKSTVLALGVEPGKGASIDHEDMPGGTGLQRVTGWELFPDMSIGFDGATITDTMYDLIAGPKAEDVPANGVPAEFFPSPLRSAWDPYQEQPAVGDPLLSREDWTFGLGAAYEVRADGTKRMVLNVTGKLPVNTFLEDVAPPIIKSQYDANSGGALQGGRNYWVVVCAYKDGDDGVRRWSPPSNIRTFKLDDVSGDSNAITVGEIVWPPIPAGADYTEFDGCSLFAGDAEQVICWQFDEEGSSLPTSLTLDAALKENTFNAPNLNHKYIRAKAKYHIHAGAVGVQITAVNSGDGSIEIGELAGGGVDWTGRVCSVFADESDGMAPLWNFTITSWDDPTGTAVLDPMPDGLEVGDVLTIRYKPIIFDEATKRIGDPLVANPQYPGGNTTDADKGQLVRGFKSGYPSQVRRITANDGDSWTVEEWFDFEPDYFIIEEADWRNIAETTPLAIFGNNVTTTIPIAAENMRRRSVVVGCFLVDRRGNECDEKYAAIREIYCFGERGFTTDEIHGFSLNGALPALTSSFAALSSPYVMFKETGPVVMVSVSAVVPPNQPIEFDLWDVTVPGSILNGAYLTLTNTDEVIRLDLPGDVTIQGGDGGSRIQLWARYPSGAPTVNAEDVNIQIGISTVPL
jgi:hypothetical protein